MSSRRTRVRSRELSEDEKQHARGQDERGNVRPADERFELIHPEDD